MTGEMAGVATAAYRRSYDGKDMVGPIASDVGHTVRRR